MMSEKKHSYSVCQKAMQVAGKCGEVLEFRAFINFTIYEKGNNFIYSTVNLYQRNNEVLLNSYSVCRKPHCYDFGQEQLAEASFQLYS